MRVDVVLEELGVLGDEPAAHVSAIGLSGADHGAFVARGRRDVAELGAAALCHRCSSSSAVAV